MIFASSTATPGEREADFATWSALLEWSFVLVSGLLLDPGSYISRKMGAAQSVADSISKRSVFRRECPLQGHQASVTWSGMGPIMVARDPFSSQDEAP